MHGEQKNIQLLFIPFSFSLTSSLTLYKPPTLFFWFFLQTISSSRMIPITGVAGIFFIT